MGKETGSLEELGIRSSKYDRKEIGKMEQKKNVLITGAGGFIGRPTVQATLKNSAWNVQVVVSGRKPYTFPDGVQVYQANLSSPQDCDRLIQEAKPEILIHLAWDLGVKGYENDISNLMWVENSLRLFRCFFQNGGRRFVFCGSGAEYGRLGGRRSESPIDVDRSAYGSGKLAFEQLCTSFARQQGWEFATARCFSVYGEGDTRKHPAVPGAITAFLNGEHFECKAPNNVWDFIHVQDVANALAAIAESSFCGVTNVATGKPSLMRHVFERIADKMGCPELLSFQEDQQNTTILVADPTVLNQEVGYRCQIDLEQGLDRTIAWWKEQQKQQQARQ